MKKTAIKAMCAAMAAAMSVAAFASCGKNPAENKFFIGATGPLTGDTSSYGISVKQGAELAVKEINAAAVTLPAHIGDVVIADVLGTGADVVVTANIE